MHAYVVVNSLFLALGLALEAFMVAIANGLKNANLRLKTAYVYGAVFAAWHVVALLLGYMLVKVIADNVNEIQSVLTWIAVAVLDRKSVV